ncbi:MAG: GAF domain-containing protein, partial [Planctomycetota bacterium]
MPTASPPKALNVLVIGLHDSDDDLHRWLDAQAHVEHVKSFTEALDALRAGPFDVVISRAADLAVLKGLYQAESTALLEAAPHGVCVVQSGRDIVGRLQETIDAIDNAGRELLSLDAEQFSRLEPHERLSLLEQKILRCTQDVLNFENFEIRVLDPNTNTLELVLFAGIPADGSDVELYAQPEGSGICGYVAAKGRSYLCPDVLRDTRYLAGIENARSSLTVPLRFQERIVGVANFESTRVAAFTEDDRQFAEIFARYIALALHLLELLVNERQVTTGQLGRNVMAEITAPLNDILTDVENLVEDYIGHDDLRHRLRTISGNAVRIRETVKELTAAKPGVIGART